MRFLTDYCEVNFPALGWSFDVYENFLEIPFGGDTITIKFYGVIIAFGFILAALFGGRKAYVWKMSLDSMVDVLIYGIIGAVVGARLYYVIFQWDEYKDNLLSIFKIWEGGLAIYGGIIGGVITAYFVAKKTKECTNSAIPQRPTANNMATIRFFHCPLYGVISSYFNSIL